MFDKLCILAPDDDAHACIIAERARSFFNIDVACFCTSTIGDSASFVYYPTSSKTIIHFHDKESITLDSHTAVWWRRPSSPKKNTTLELSTMRDFSIHEFVTSFSGAVLASAGRVSNNPGAERTAAHKTYQLKMASSVGLHIPETLVTNIPEKAKEFLTTVDGEAIYKVHHAPKNRLIDVRPITADSLNLLDNLAYAPVIFQKKIHPAKEIRSLVLKQQVLSYTATVKNKNDTIIDIRLQEETIWSRVSIPKETENRLISLCSKLGLDSCVVDMLLDDHGTIWFLESNCSGQFLFMDESSNDIKDAFIKNLLE